MPYFPLAVLLLLGTPYLMSPIFSISGALLSFKGLSRESGFIYTLLLSLDRITAFGENLNDRIEVFQVLLSKLIEKDRFFL